MFCVWDIDSFIGHSLKTLLIAHLPTSAWVCGTWQWAGLAFPLKKHLKCWGWPLRHRLLPSDPSPVRFPHTMFSLNLCVGKWIECFPDIPISSFRCWSFHPSWTKWRLQIIGDQTSSDPSISLNVVQVLIESLGRPAACQVCTVFIWLLYDWSLFFQSSSQSKITPPQMRPNLFQKVFEHHALVFQDRELATCFPTAEEAPCNGGLVDKTSPNRDCGVGCCSRAALAFFCFILQRNAPP